LSPLRCGQRQFRAGERVQPCELSRGELDVVGGGVLLDARDAPGAGDRGDVVALGEQPGQGDLGRGCTDLGGDGSDLVDDTQVSPEVLPGEPRVVLAPVVVGDVIRSADLTGDEAVTQR
jgi:hypothetical protein